MQILTEIIKLNLHSRSAFIIDTLIITLIIIINI